MRQPRSAASQVIRIGSAFASLLVGVTLTELGLRRFAPQPLSTAYHSDSGLVLNIPNVRVRYARADFDHVITTNSLGLRDREVEVPKPEGTFRILMLGDSFVEAKEVEPDRTFTKRLQAGLAARSQARPVEVINAGITGYGTGQELKLFRLYGRSLQPDMVILAFFVGNDLVNNGWMQAFRWHRGTLEEVVPPKLAGRALRMRRVREYLGSHFHLYQFVRDRVGSATRRADIEAAELFDNELDLVSTEPSSLHEQHWRITEALLDKLREEVTGAGAGFLLLALPPRFQVEEDAWNDLQQRAEAPLDREAPQKRLAAYARARNVPFCDPLPALREAGRSGPLYYRIDAHFNDRGHAVVARVLLESLDPDGLTPATSTVP